MAQSNNSFTLPEHIGKYKISRKSAESCGEAIIRLKKSTIHHERTRAIAEFLWSIEPELTIVEMARRSEITKFGCEGEEYDVRTVCRWLSSLKGYSRPGRPRKRMTDGL